ncbi:MAG: hypothetical protein NT046_00865 [Arenimonas sp.]|nr:hypothetical protein [Arenimonas sp.]
MSTHRASAWAALPDGITAAGFALVWLFPFALDELSVKTALLVMLLEFFLIHATGFFTAIGGSPKVSRAWRMLALAGLTLFYLAMVGAFALSFGEWWPVLAFLWLAVGKAAWAWSTRPGDGDDAMALPMVAWAGSVVAYLFGAFLTALVPVPRLGMTEEVQPGFGLDGGGLWIDEPHRVVAFGLVYFGLLCAAKLLMARGGKR